MKEILSNSISQVEYKIYVNGVLTDATGNVTLSVYRDGFKVVDSVTATKPGSTTGTYTYILPMLVVIDTETIPVVTTEGELEVQWSFTVSSKTLEVSDRYVVVTPYSKWEYFSAVTTYQEYLECERVARHIINSYCGQEFGQENTTYALEGHGQNSLSLPRKLQTLESITWINVEFPYRPGGVIGYDLPYAWELYSNGWSIRRQPYYDRIDPLYNPRYAFRRNITYNVKGLWGYPGVPTPVEEASKIIVADLLCPDHKYRDKYLDNIKMGDWRIQFTSGAFVGTGNATADHLLADYRLTPGIGMV